MGLHMSNGGHYNIPLGLYTMYAHWCEPIMYSWVLRHAHVCTCIVEGALCYVLYLS